MARFETKFISKVLMRSVELTVIIPSPTIPEALGYGNCAADYKNDAPFPVLYLLHGLGNSHGDWTSYSNVELFAEEQSIAVVMLSGENKFYRKNGDGDDFFAFVSQELPQFIRKMFPVSHKSQDTYIAGLSMGGYGALIHGLNHPEQFGAIGAFSAAVGVETEQQQKELRGGIFDPWHLVERAAEQKVSVPPIYFACGMQDMLWDNVTSFKNHMLQHGLHVTWVPEDGFKHEWRFWNIQIEKFLEWLPRTDAYAQNQKNHRAV